MHLFSDYLQPLTYWLYTHPTLALFLTFIIAWAESLAVVGSIVPGSVTMTTVGILAGSGIMRVDLTFLAAISGAIVGDSSSYLLGYTFSDRLSNMWPFKKHPSWLIAGQDYFEQHGGKSVLIGRFIGPLRSIIPVIAGMLRMKQTHFFFANVVSAIGWAVLYVTPGILIGAASNELTAEGATRLFIFILLSLVLLWLMTRIMQWLLVKLGNWLQPKLRKSWQSYSEKAYFSKILKVITPYEERDHAVTIAWLLGFLISSCMTLILLVLIIHNTWVSDINTPTYLFLQSLRTHAFDLFFMCVSLLISPFPLITITLAMSLFAVYRRDWRLLRYWLALGFSVVAVMLFFAMVLDDIPKPSTLLYTKKAAPLLPVNYTIASALFTFLVLYLNAYYQRTTAFTLQVILLSLVILTGTSKIYLGDCWISSVIGSYFISLTLCLLTWMLYRRRLQKKSSPIIALVLVCFSLIISAGLTYPILFPKLSRQYYLHYPQYVVTPSAWWQQHSNILLPLHIKSRVGQQIGLFNIQYSGSLDRLETVLAAQGWKKQRGSFLFTLLQRASGEGLSKATPLISQLYLNQKPALVMARETDMKEVLVLRLWRSNFHLLNYKEPLWIGSINNQAPKNKIKKSPALQYERFNVDKTQLNLPNTFKIKDIQISGEANQHTYTIHLIKSDA